MKKIINILLLILKYILFLAAFALTFYIVLSMYRRLDKNMGDSISIFLPYGILLIIYFINIIFRQSSVNKNIFYNLTCCLVFLTTIVVGLRAIYDTNMIMNEIMGYNINFVYFGDYISFMKVLIYGLIISNVLFMVHLKGKKVENEEKPIAKKIEVEVL